MKISIIGVGHVGSVLAYTLMLRGLGDELVLVGRDQEKTKGHALDLEHGKAFTSHPMHICQGEIQDAGGSDIIVITASVPWDKSYNCRFDIGKGNLALFQNMIPVLAENSPNAKFLIITNPVDVMTYHAIRISGLSAKQVFGIGTLIDSARFRTMLASEIGIHPDDLRAYILGEHGETQFPDFSLAVVGGTRIVQNSVTQEVFRKTSRAGFEVVNRKGHSNFAISLAATLVIESIIWDTRRTMPLSILIEDFLGESDVCLSMPVVVGRQGITQVLEPDFGENEVKSFHQCAAIIRQAIDQSLT